MTKNIIRLLLPVLFLLSACGPTGFEGSEPGLPAQPTYRNFYIIAELYAIFPDGSLEPMNGEVSVILDGIDSEGGRGFAKEKIPLDRKAELHFGEWRFRIQINPEYPYKVTLTTVITYERATRHSRLLCKIASDIGELNSQFTEIREGGKGTVACSADITPVSAN